VQFAIVCLQNIGFGRAFVLKRCKKAWLIAGMIWAEKAVNIYERISHHIDPIDHPASWSFTDLALQR
jgi:hypothetical protein